ncbi:MAG: response regulator [Desulfovibrio sp.]|uniref:response regulator n=1 Tax=Desulfovibrio sp. 7SRBS1 TaxID=3378064 RepID=UPI003B3EA2D8
MNTSKHPSGRKSTRHPEKAKASLPVRIWRRFFNAGINTKVSLLTIAISTLIFLAFGIYDYQAIKHQMLRDINDSATIISTGLSKMLLTPVWNVDLETIEGIMATEMEDKRIYALYITERDGSVFTGFMRDANWDIVPYNGEPGTNLISRGQEMTMSGHNLGTLTVLMTKRFIQEELGKSLLMTALRTILMEGLLVLCIYGFMKSLLINPIRQLTYVVSSVSRRKDYSLRATKWNNDEIGELTDNINKTLHMVEERNLQLKRYSISLEEQVAQRTRELVDSNSRLKSVNEELAQASRMAEKANRAKSEFLANISHEIRTPMNAILGVAELFRSTSLDERQDEFVGIIKNSATSLLGLLNDILDFSKIEAGEMAVEQIPFSLHDLINEATDMYSESAGGLGLDFVVDIGPEVPDHLIGDPLRLRQVLLNLLSNAFKFTSKGEIVLAVSGGRPVGNIVPLTFSIQDSGIGIPEDKLSSLFQAFTQADGSTTRRFGGTGLGLAICRRLVTLMDGEIGVESTAGVGSTFTFNLKFPLDPKAPPSQAELVLPPPLAGSKVLLVEDNSISLRVAARMLSSFGLEVVGATSAEEGLQTLDEQPENSFSMVFMDWRLPNVDGVEACRRITNDPRYKHIPVLLMTAYSSQLKPSGLRKAGVRGLVKKPLRKSVLFAAVMETGGLVVPGQDAKEKLGTVFDRSQLDGVSVLLVEDNAVNRRVAGEILSMAGMTTRMADNGREALELLKKEHFDVVLMDLQMPIMDGITATHRIRDDLDMTDLPIIAMTAHAMEDDRRACIEAGMNDYVSKPINSEQLFRAIRNSLGLAPGTNEPAGPKLVGAGSVLAGGTTPPKVSSRAASLDIMDQPKVPEETGNAPDEAESNEEGDARMEPPKSLDGFDVEDGMERLAGNWPLYYDILKEFVANYESFDQDVQKFRDASDFDGLRNYAHALKGAAGNVSAIDLRLAAMDLEQASAQEDLAGIEEHVHNVRKVLKRTSYVVRGLA